MGTDIGCAMIRQIPYGNGACLTLRVSAKELLADLTSPKHRPLDDPIAAIAAALHQPLNFPPLSRATVPGDRIAIALGRDVPRADAVVAGIVHTLLEGSAAPERIRVVREVSEKEEADTDAEITSLLAPSIRSAITVQRHRPEDRGELSYLAASKDGLPIYFNRTIFDADVILPVSCLRLQESLGYIGVHGGLFPSFSDQATRQRFSTPRNLRAGGSLSRRRREADEAAWLLGVQFCVQVVPGPGDSLLHVLAGDAADVAHEGQKLCQAAWLHDVPRRADLVVASIEGGPRQQTWDNFARALFAANQIVRPSGTIVICTQLKRRPGPAMRRLRAALPDDDTIRAFGRDRSPDAVPASLLLETREHAHVYLISDLEGDVVEELGLAHVSDAGQVDRLMSQHETCILLANAHQAIGHVPY